MPDKVNCCSRKINNCRRCYLAPSRSVSAKVGDALVGAFLKKFIPRLSQISWETEVWIAEDPEHVVHFNGERFLGPYPDTVFP